MERTHAYQVIGRQSLFPGLTLSNKGHRLIVHKSYSPFVFPLKYSSFTLLRLTSRDGHLLSELTAPNTPTMVIMVHRPTIVLGVIPFKFEEELTTLTILQLLSQLTQLFCNLHWVSLWISFHVLTNGNSCDKDYIILVFVIKFLLATYDILQL